MARLRVNDYIDICTNNTHNATSWQVALDPDFTQIIDQSLKDTVNVKEWVTPLPKIDGNGYYADLDNLYSRVKVHIDDTESPWFVMEPVNQNKQRVIYTYPDGHTEEYDSLEIGLN